jgi:hypothetical protein
MGDFSSIGDHVPGRFLRAYVAVLALALVWAPSASAVAITFDGALLRYREREGAVQVRLERYPMYGAPVTHLVLTSSPYFSGEAGQDTVFGCAGPPASDSGQLRLTCPLTSPPADPVSYRFSLEGPDPMRGYGTDDQVAFAFTSLQEMRGVVYGGAGNDIVSGGDRVYGGRGHDDLDGARVYGGAGADDVSGDVASDLGRRVVLRGGPGTDTLSGPGSTYGGGGTAHLYGGAGDDELETWTDPASREMLVGGRGSDVVRLAADGRRDVVRVRGGGVDLVNCGRRAEPEDALFVDPSDRLSSSCKNATVLFTGRPRYPYP